MSQHIELLQLLKPIVNAVLFIGAVGMICFVYDLLKRKRNSRRPVVEVKARVVGRRIETVRSFGRYHRNVHHYYFVSFKPEDGSPAVEFQVSDILYNSYEHGEVDLLRYRGWELLSFGTNLEDVKPIAPLPEEHNWQPEDESRWHRMLRWINAKLWDWADYPLRAWDWLCEVLAETTQKRGEKEHVNDKPEKGLGPTHKLDE